MKNELFFPLNIRMPKLIRHNAYLCPSRENSFGYQTPTTRRNASLKKEENSSSAGQKTIEIPQQSYLGFVCIIEFYWGHSAPSNKGTEISWREKFVDVN